MADQTNILEQTVEYQSLDLLRLKGGQVVQITDESIDIWTTAESHQRGDKSNQIYFAELVSHIAHPIYTNPNWTSHNITPAVALHYDKAGWEPHCTGGGCDYPIYEFGPPLDSKSGGTRWEIWACHHDDGGAPDSPTDPVWAHLYDMEIDDQSTWWSLRFDSSAALTHFVASHDLDSECHVAEEQILAAFFASEFHSGDEHEWDNIDLPISRFYGHHGWDYNVTGGGCNFPALWFGPVRKDADGNDGRHLIMVGMKEDVGVAPEDITKPVAAVLYDECLYGQAGETEYIRVFPSSLALIDYVRTFDLETEKGMADIIAKWHNDSIICEVG